MQRFKDAYDVAEQGMQLRKDVTESKTDFDCLMTWHVMCYCLI